MFTFLPRLPHLATSSGGLQEETPPGHLEELEKSRGLFLSSFAPAQSTQPGKGTAGPWVPNPQPPKEGVGRGVAAAWWGAGREQLRARLLHLWSLGCTAASYAQMSGEWLT